VEKNEKPALQKEDTEWNTLVKTAGPRGILSFQTKKRSTAPAASTVKVKTNIILISCFISTMGLGRNDSLIIHLSFVPRLLPMKRKRKTEKVMIPRPPSWIRVITTILPNTVSFVPMSITVSPVTQTAEIAVKKASSPPSGSPFDATGSLSRTAPTIAVSRKLRAMKSPGGILWILLFTHLPRLLRFASYI